MHAHAGILRTYHPCHVDWITLLIASPCKAPRAAALGALHTAAAVAASTGCRALVRADEWLPHKGAAAIPGLGTAKREGELEAVSSVVAKRRRQRLHPVHLSSLSGSLLLHRAAVHFADRGW